MSENLEISQKIKVSVCVVTYNQEKYIAKCLQSILDQETDFDFDVIVSDDCSKDKTREIINSFAEKYPEKIKPIFHPKNIGASRNFIYTHQQAEGDYIAHVDGDDYCLPGKLQAQSDYLDANPECNIVWHPVIVEMPDGTFKKTSVDAGGVYRRKFYRRDIIRFISVGANSSKMYRRAVRDFEFPDFEVVDYFANVEQVGEGFAAFASDAPLGVYRAGIGVASSGSKTREILDECFMFFFKKYDRCRLEVNFAVLTYLLADLKNRRPTANIFFKSYLRTFHPLSIFLFLRDYKLIRSM